MSDKFCCDFIALRHHQKQSHVMVKFKGIQVSVQYQASMPILSYICKLAPRIISHIFNHSIFIAFNKKSSSLEIKILMWIKAIKNKKTQKNITRCKTLQWFVLLIMYQNSYLQLMTDWWFVFLFFKENRIRHFMQIVSTGGNLHKISNPVF